MSPALSIVVPVYGCAQCLVALHDRLVAALVPLAVDFELILVEDASPDGCWETITSLAAAHPQVRGLRLARNFGQHAAIRAGIEEATGTHVVVMDCDLQDPPEDVPRLLTKAAEGHDIVLARRKLRKHPISRRALSRLYTWLLNRLVPFAIDPELGAFSLLSRRAVDAFRRARGHRQHYLFSLHTLGFAAATIDYVQAARGDHGGSSYSFTGLVRLALRGLFLQTTRSPRLLVLAGAACVLLGATIAWASGRPTPAGWVLLGLGGVLVGVGISALLLGRALDGRPQFIVAERLDAKAAEATTARTPP